MATIGTFNEEGTNVDLYIPRKCHATGTLISSYDYSSVQIAIANVDANGVIDGTTTTFCITGYLRAQGEADHAINHLAIERGIIRIKSAKPKKVNKKKKAPKAAAPQRGAKATQKGVKPQAAAKGAKPQGQKGAKPQAAAKGAKPQAAAKGAKPQAAKSQAPRKSAPVKKH